MTSHVRILCVGTDSLYPSFLPGAVPMLRSDQPHGLVRGVQHLPCAGLLLPGVQRQLWPGQPGDVVDSSKYPTKIPQSSRPEGAMETETQCLLEHLSQRFANPPSATVTRHSRAGKRCACGLRRESRYFKFVKSLALLKNEAYA